MDTMIKTAAEVEVGDTVVVNTFDAATKEHTQSLHTVSRKGAPFYGKLGFDFTSGLSMMGVFPGETVNVLVK